jgi:hypothetical protein
MQKVLAVLLSFIVLFPFNLAKAEQYTVTNQSLFDRLKGRIVIKTEDSGKAYYVSPYEKKMYYLSDANAAYQVMRQTGLGIGTNDLNKILVGTQFVTGTDADDDGDGLPNVMEKALGTLVNGRDTDGDGYDDYTEYANNYSPFNKLPVKSPVDSELVSRLSGRILLQVQGHGEAWYVYPIDHKRYYLGSQDDAYFIMRNLSLGINNADFNSLTQ